MIAVAIAGCGNDRGDDVDADAGVPAIELSGFTIALDPPARSMAVFAEPARQRISVVLADEITSRVELYTTGLADAPLLAHAGGGFAGLGPRAVVALPGRVVTADTVAKTLTVLSVDGSGLTSEATVPLDRPPLAMTAGDLDGDGHVEVAAISGSDVMATLQVWREVAPGELMLAMEFGVPQTTEVGLTEDGWLLNVRRNVGDGQWLQFSDPLSGPVELCADAHAPIAYAGGIALACSTGVMVAMPGAPAGQMLHQFSGVLYGLAAGDLDGDGLVDLAAVDLAAHQLVIWPGAGGAPQLVPVSRGPIALELFDLDTDGDLDVLVLAFEAHALDVLLNQRIQQGG